MTNNNAAHAGREMLTKAHIESQDGVDVIVHVEGIPPLLLRDVEPIADDDVCAAVRTWTNNEVPAASWIISLGSVRGVEILDAMLAPQIEKAQRPS